MNEQWAHEQMQTIVSETPPTPFSLESVVQRGETARRRRKLMRAAGVAAVAVSLLAVVSIPVLADRSHPPDTKVAGSIPAKLTVSCAGSTPTIDGTTVAASPDGVHFAASASSSDTSVAYLFDPATSGSGWFGPPGPAGTNAVLSSQSREIVWDIPPGPVDVSCVKGDADSPKIRILVVDPQGYYRSGDIRKLGCTSTALMSLKGPASAGAPTVDGVIQKLATQNKVAGSLSYERIPMGYVETRQQLYVLRVDGKNWRILLVQPVGQGYSADTYGLCR
ncbi:hypothetical protein [Actinoplanes sp. HUAS TT8]|uniref:hypothetical protein n=1 Tax=Actinoplanes sp. HUAS TT8 TaxID=3447453 RepID=UPI003F529084